MSKTNHVILPDATPAVLDRAKSNRRRPRAVGSETMYGDSLPSMVDAQMRAILRDDAAAYR